MLGGACLGSGNVFDGVWWGGLKVRRHGLKDDKNEEESDFWVFKISFIVFDGFWEGRG